MAEVHKSTIDAFRSLGGPAVLPGSVESLQSAQNFPQPEARVNMPDIRMQIGGKPDEENRDLEQLLRMMSAGRSAQRGIDAFTKNLKERFEIPGRIREIEDDIAATPQNDLVRLGELTKDLINIRNKEAEITPEASQKDYNTVWEMGFQSVEDVFAKSIDQRKNAYPYDHRMAEQTIGMLQETSLVLQEEKWVENNPEAKVWFKRMERDAAYFASFLHISVVQSASLPMHYDSISQLQLLKDRYHAWLNNSDLIKMNSAEIPGLEFGPQPYEDLKPEEKAKKETEKQLASTKVGFSIPDKYQTTYKISQPAGTPDKIEMGVGLIKNGEKVGLKELSTRLQDESFEARMKVAAVSQLDLRLPKDEMLKSTFKKEFLTERDVEFFNLVFWKEFKKLKPKDGWENPNADAPDPDKDYNNSFGILAPHVMSNDEDKKDSEARLEALLTTNALERLKEFTGTEQEVEDKIMKLANEVLKEANRRLKSWETRGAGDIVSRIAVLVTAQGLLQDYSFMHSYRYCWQFLWKKDYGFEDIKNGKVLSSEGFGGVDIAGIFTRSGDQYTLLNHLRRSLDYDQNSNTRTQEILPSSLGGREEASPLGRDKMPMVYKNENGEYILNLDAEGAELIDPFLREQLNFLFSNEAAYVKMREDLGYKDIQEDVKAKLMAWAIRWRTPYSTKDVGEPSDVDIVVPYFIPTGLDIANFFEAMTTGEMKLNDGGESVWDELVKGEKLSKINWKRLEEAQHARWLVDLDMSSNFMHILVDYFDKEREGFLNTVTGNPVTAGPKEIAKRIRLTFRDSEKGYPEDYEISLIAVFITLAVANKHNIMAPESWKLPGDGKTKTTEVENFLAEMAVWKRAFKWLPSDRPGGARARYKNKNNDPRLYDKASEKDLKNKNVEKRADGYWNTKTNKKVFDLNGYKLDKNGKILNAKWNYGNTIALMAEFYEPVLLRMAKSSAESALSANVFAKQNYMKTVARINSMGFMGKGNLPVKPSVDINPA